MVNLKTKTAALIRVSFKLLAQCVTAPDLAFEAIDKSDDALLSKTVALYGFYLLVSLLSFLLKPSDFPPSMFGTAPAVTLNLHTWFITELLSGAGFVSSVFLLSIVVPFSLRFGESLLLPLCAAFALMPCLFLLLFSNAHNSGMLFLFCMMFFYAGLWFIGHRPDFQYRKLISMSILISTIYIPGMALQIPATLLRSADIYLGIEVLIALWTLALTIKGVSYFCQLSIAKSATVVIAEIMACFILIYSAARVGLISQTTLAFFLLT